MAYFRANSIGVLAKAARVQKLTPAQFAAERVKKRMEKRQRAADKLAAIIAELTALREPGAEPTRPAASSRGELYQWHKQNGTLGIYFAMYPNG